MRFLIIIITVLLLTACGGYKTHSECMDEGKLSYDGVCTYPTDIPPEDQERVFIDFIDETAERTGLTQEQVIETMNWFIELEE